LGFAAGTQIASKSLQSDEKYVSPVEFNPPEAALNPEP